MKFKQYRLQILVEDIPLEECWESLDNNNHITRTESSSYAQNDKSETIHYAAVNVNYGTRFSVRFSAEDATQDQPIKAYLSVDGNWDFTYYQLTNEEFRKENGFWNKDRNKKYYFKFIPTISSSNSKPTNNNDSELDSKELNDNKFPLKKSGSPGCVSVYFYRAKRVNQRCKVPNFNINQTSAEMFNKDISLFTGFDEEFREQNDDIQTGVVNLKRISKRPIAELHLHYRDISYLIERGLISPILLTPKNDIICENYFATRQKTESMIAPIYLGQSEIDKGEGILIKENRLDKMSSNKRSPYISEKQPSKKRAKDNFYVLKTTAQCEDSLDNFKVVIPQLVTFDNNVTEKKLTKNVEDRGFVESKNFKNVELKSLLQNKIKEQSEVKTLSIKPGISEYIKFNFSSQQVNSLSTGNEVIIIEDSDDSDISMCIETPPIVLYDDFCNGKIKSSKASQKQDKVICLSDGEEEVVFERNDAPRLHEIKKRKKVKNSARRSSGKLRIEASKSIDDVIVLSD